MINTKAYLEAARFMMVEYGGYTDAEVDVLCTSPPFAKQIRTDQIADAYMKDVTEKKMYTR